MHELSIAQSIVEAVSTKATECRAARVKIVRLRIGEAVGIVVDSLTFCFEMMTDLDPMLRGAQLSIDSVPHRARCIACGQEYPIVNFVMQCPQCKAWSSEVISGAEFQIMDMEIDLELVSTSPPPG
jgi:hydrogenase nickel incorporation protein HypA/HybF